MPSAEAIKKAWDNYNADTKNATNTDAANKNIHDLETQLIYLGHLKENDLTQTYGDGDKYKDTKKTTPEKRLAALNAFRAEHGIASRGDQLDQETINALNRQCALKYAKSNVEINADQQSEIARARANAGTAQSGASPKVTPASGGGAKPDVGADDDVQAQVDSLKSAEAKKAASLLLQIPGYRELANKQGLKTAVLVFQVESNDNLGSTLELDGKLGPSTQAKINEVIEKKLEESVSAKSGNVVGAAKPAQAPSPKPAPGQSAANPPAPDSTVAAPGAGQPPLPGMAPDGATPPLPGTALSGEDQAKKFMETLESAPIEELFKMFMMMMTVMMQRLSELSPEQRKELREGLGETKRAVRELDQDQDTRSRREDTGKTESADKDDSVLNTLDAKTRALVVDAANKLTNDANDNFISRGDVEDNLKGLRKAGGISLNTHDKQRMADLSSSLTAEVVDDKNITPEELARILKAKGLIAAQADSAGDAVTPPSSTPTVRNNPELTATGHA